MTETSAPAAAMPAVDSPLVWVDGWQMACSGEPFSVGSEVAWFFEPAHNSTWFEAVIGGDPDLRLPLAEEHHSQESAGARVPGTTVITELSAVSPVAPVPLGGARTGVTGAAGLAGSDDGIDPAGAGEISFFGGLVDLQFAPPRKET